MNRISKFFGFVLALALATAALPSYAAQSQNKTYSLDANVLLQGNSVAPSHLQLVIKNTSPSQSSSTINSVDMFVDLAWSIINDPANDPTHPLLVYETNNPTSYYTADTSVPGHIKVSQLAVIKPFVSSNNALVLDFWVTASSSGDGSWEGNVWSGAGFSGNLFTRNGGQNIAMVASAALACGDSKPSATPTAGTITVTRDPWNKNGTSSGTTCDPVNYYASNTLTNYVGLPPNIVHFRWDLSGTDLTFSSAAFEYAIYYSGTAAPNTRVGWFYKSGALAIGPGANPNSDPNNPVVFIDTPVCLADQLPTPYGSLNTQMNSSTTTLKIDLSTGSLTPPTTVPQPDGFPIYVEEERMQVTGYSSSGWTVKRGQLGTKAVSHPKYALVMSTPLPSLGDIAPAAYVLLADGTYATAPTNPYKASTQAQMCIAGTSPTGASVPFNKIIDIGDGWGVPR